MKKKFNNKKLCKSVLIVFIVIYFFIIFVNQEKTLLNYKKTKLAYEEEREDKLSYQESLYESKSNLSSEEYIEEMARDKLDMYLPNERVYVDKTK